MRGVTQKMSKKKRIMKELTKQLKSIDNNLKAIRETKEKIEYITKQAKEGRERTGAKEYDDILKDAKTSIEEVVKQEEESLKLKEEALKLKKELE